MKRITSLVILSLWGGLTMAQSQENRMVPQRIAADPQEEFSSTQNNSFTDSEGSPEAVIWSEDFANGIPSTWSNQGYDGTLNPMAAAKWEYRGPSTTPDNTTGSRGAYAAPKNPIRSSTASNGFIIFDSSYLDNGGNPNTQGQGPAPAPHVGTLTTDIIDLSGHNFIELSLQNYARNYHAKFLACISTDGGNTWPDTLNLFPELDVNIATAHDETINHNISKIAGGKSQVKLRFIFDGRLGSKTGGYAYYFWMLDDVVIRDLPKNKLVFTPFNRAPAHDIIYDNNSREGKYGFLTIKQNRSINFDANILNYGQNTQNGVKLGVDILKATDNSLVTSLSSSANTSPLSMLDTANFNQMSTSTAWTPSATGRYKIVYKATSDSVNASKGIMPADTFYISVTDTIMALDHGVPSNSFGTRNLGNDGSEIGIRLDLKEPERLFGVYAWLSSISIDGGLVEVEVYDTTGFDFKAGFPTKALVSKRVSVTADHIKARYIRVDLTTNGIPLLLDKDSYYITMRMYSNAGKNPIQILNGRSFPQTGRASIMFSTRENRWFTGVLNSQVFNSPFIRAVLCDDKDANCMFLNVQDIKEDMNITIGQNELTKEILVNFNELNANGVEISLMDIKGSILYESKVNVSSGQREVISAADLNPGVYILRVNYDNHLNTYKLMIQ